MKCSTATITERRRKQRGAAMLEAIVVITVLLAFLGLIMWSERAYAAKIDQATATRSDVLYYASHACAEAPPADDPARSSAISGATTTENATGDADSAQAETTAGKLNDDSASAGLSRDWNMASASREETVDGSAIVDLQKVALSTKVKTQSVVACNEKHYGDKPWTELGSFVIELVKSGGGLL